MIHLQSILHLQAIRLLQAHGIIYSMTRFKDLKKRLFFSMIYFQSATYLFEFIELPDFCDKVFVKAFEDSEARHPKARSNFNLQWLKKRISL